MNPLERNNQLFLFTILALILAVVLQFRFQGWFGYSPDLVLALMVAASFFLPFVEFLFLVVLGAWLLNWQPVLGYEMVAMMALPILVFWARRFLPGKLYFSLGLATFLVLILFYIPVGPSVILNGWLVFESFALSLFFGLLISYPMSYFSKA